MASYTSTDLVSAQLGGESITTSTTPSTDDVEQWIKEAEDEIDSRTGLTFKPEGFEDLILDYEKNDDIIRLPFEIVSITTLYYNSESAGETPSWTLKTKDTDYYVYSEEGEIEIIPSKFNALRGKNRFKITGVKGKTVVPNIIKRLATLMVANRFVETVVQSQAYSNSGGDVQVGTIKVGNPSSFSVSAVNSRKSEIDDLFTKAIGDFRTFRITRAYDL